MIGIIVADSNEINKFDFKLIEKNKVNQFEFSIYEINGEAVVVTHSGIGIANAAAATQEMISTYNVSEIFNYGAVGATGNLDIYDLITPEKIYYHDVVTPWYKRGQTPGEHEYYKNAIKSEANQNLASGSSFLANKALIDEVRKDIDVSIFDMETAAIAQICNKNNVQLKVIKCVSDIIGKDDTQLEDINSRIANAGKKAFDKMIEIIKN